jgi:hypothetical protein
MACPRSVSRWLVRWCGVGLLTLSAGGLLATNALAAGGKGFMWDFNTGLCLSSSISSGQVSTKSCDSSNNRQIWHYNRNTTHWLINHASGKCLTAYSDGTVATRTCRPNVTRQEWKEGCDSSTGVVSWKNRATHENLASFHDGHVDLQPRGSGGFQKWFLGGFTPPVACGSAAQSH